MKPLGLVVAKIATVLFALTLLTGYVCFRQEIGPFANTDPPLDFPVTPASPSMFSTPKSGPVLTPPSDPTVTFSGTKSGFIVTPSEDGQTPLTAEDIDALIEQASPEKPVIPPTTENEILLMPGTKSVNMPIFRKKLHTEPLFLNYGERFKSSFTPREPQKEDLSTDSEISSGSSPLQEKDDTAE